MSYVDHLQGIVLHGGLTNHNVTNDLWLFKAAKESLEKLDFWVGNWKLTWTGGSGTNFIEKKLGRRVIQENFSAIEGSMKGFEGTSISTYSGGDGKWHQAWADSEGGYFDFIGIMDNDSRTFQTTIPRTGPNGKSYIYRMRFHDIAADRFIWDWERSADSGKTWELSWRINYERVK